MTTTNSIPRSAKSGATLFFAKFKIDTIVKNETIDHSLSYLLGRNASSCVVFHVYSYYPNYSAYEIKERLRVFIEAIFRTKNQNKLIKYLRKEKKVFEFDTDEEFLQSEIDFFEDSNKKNDSLNKSHISNKDLNTFIKEDELAKAILKGCTKTSIEKLYEFLNAGKRTPVSDTSLVGLLKVFTNFKE
jgi:hypothetical protein